jgi:hypothetical protein
MNNNSQHHVPDEILQFDFESRIFTFESNTSGVKGLVDEIIGAVGIGKLPEITEQVLDSYHLWKQRNYNIALGELLPYFDELKTKEAQNQQFDDFLRSKSETAFERTEDVIIFIKDAVIEFGSPVFNQLEKYIRGQYSQWHKRSDVIDLTKIDAELERVKKSLKNATVSTTLVSSGSVISQTNLVAQPSNESGQTYLVSAYFPNRKNFHVTTIVCLLSAGIIILLLPASIWTIAFSVILLVVWLIFFCLFISSDKLAKKFLKLGDMSGMTYSQIEAVVGPCTSQSMQLGSDRKPSVVRVWDETTYNISLMFDKNDNFVGVIPES